MYVGRRITNVVEGAVASANSTPSVSDTHLANSPLPGVRSNRYLIALKGFENTIATDYIYHIDRSVDSFYRHRAINHREAGDNGLGIGNHHTFTLCYRPFLESEHVFVEVGLKTDECTRTALPLVVTVAPVTVYAFG